MSVSPYEAHSFQEQTEFIAPDGMLFRRVIGIDPHSGAPYSGLLAHDNSRFIHDGQPWTPVDEYGVAPTEYDRHDEAPVQENDFVVQILDAPTHVEDDSKVPESAQSIKPYSMTRRDTLQLAVHNYVLGDKDLQRQVGGMVVGLAMRKRSVMIAATKLAPVLALVGIAVPGPVDEIVLGYVVVSTVKGVTKEYLALRAEQQATN